jgi:hypothetical protein
MRKETVFIAGMALTILMTVSCGQRKQAVQYRVEELPALADENAARELRVLQELVKEFREIQSIPDASDPVRGRKIALLRERIAAETTRPVSSSLSAVEQGAVRGYRAACLGAVTAER